MPSRSLLRTYLLHAFPSTQHPLMRVVHLAFAGILLVATAWPSTARAADERTTTQPATQHYDIAAGPLSEVLTQFSAQAGIYLVGASTLAQGKTSPGVKGNYSVDEALKALLAGTGVVAERNEQGQYRLGTAPSAMTTLEPVSVVASNMADGSAQDGYIVSAPSAVGPWQGRTLQDTPYSINVYSEDLIENLQATTPDQVYRINPTTQLVRPQHENNQPRIMMRGFTVQKSYRDGVPDDQYNHTATMEDTARIELLNGLSGFLYGANNIGGVTNYVTKHSTDERLNQLTLSSLGNESWYAHGDFGGKFDAEGKYGYRINVAEQGGETAIDRQEIEKSFYSVALDGYLFEDFWLQVHAMDYTYDVNGSQAYWYFGAGVTRPAARRIDNDISWGQPWTNRWYDYNRYGMNMKWEISDNVGIRAAYIDNRGDRGSESASNTLTSGSTYNQVISGVYAPGIDRLLSHQRDTGAALYADVAFDTGNIQHKLTTGVQYSDSRQYRMDRDSAAAVNVTNLSLSSPTVISRPTNVAPVDRGDLTESSHNEYRNIVLGDDMTFNEQWSALVGAAHTTITQKSDTTYKESALTPSLSVLYKPLESLTTYVSYIEALENGGTAADEYEDTPVVNAGEVFEPLISEQIEIGAKTEWAGVALSAALFRIEKGLQYYDISNPAAPRYVQDGRQVHQGIELTVIGNIIHNLNIISGFTWLDAQVKEQHENPALEGKEPADVAEQLFKVRLEYTVPQVQNLSVSTGAIYNGSSYGDVLNTDEVPAYTLFDVGARYEMDLAGKPLTLHLDLHNVGNKHYWNGFNGTRIGDPRTLLLSASIKL